jgi:hypothetical protein
VNALIRVWFHDTLAGCASARDTRQAADTCPMQALPDSKQVASNITSKDAVQAAAARRAQQATCEAQRTKAAQMMPSGCPRPIRSAAYPIDPDTYDLSTYAELLRSVTPCESHGHDAPALAEAGCSRRAVGERRMKPSVPACGCPLQGHARLSGTLHRRTITTVLIALAALYLATRAG